jgi:hypothetical protein
MIKPIADNHPLYGQAFAQSPLHWMAAKYLTKKTFLSIIGGTGKFTLLTKQPELLC